MTKNILSTAILAAAGVALSASSAMAQNTTYAPGDVVLYFEQYLGSNTVAVNLGSAVTFRNATANILNIANIGSQLSNGTTGFGSSWYDSTSLWMGAAAVRSTGTTTTTQVNGDPNRTLYISQGRSTAGTAGSANSAGWGGFSNGDMTTGATAINNAVNRMETQSSTTTLVEGTATSNFDNQNPFNILGQPVTSYGIFPGGVMASFGASNLGSLGGVTGVEAALDLYRILATTNPSGTVVESGESAFNGSFQGTFVINSSGDVSYLAPVAVPEPTTMGATLALGLVAAGIRRRLRVAA